jgi:hypothetical protein
MRGKCLKGAQCPFSHERQDLLLLPSAGERDRAVIVAAEGGDGAGGDLKRKAESILTKHSFKKNLPSHLLKKRDPPQSSSAQPSVALRDEKNVEIEASDETRRRRDSQEERTEPDFIASVAVKSVST